MIYERNRISMRLFALRTFWRLFADIITTLQTRNLCYIRMANYGYPAPTFTSWKPGNVRRPAEARDVIALSFSSSRLDPQVLAFCFTWT